MAGTLPAELERLINELSQSKLPWKEIIKKEIINGLGKTVISDWKKSSRRYALLPGNKRLISPNIWILVDTSGSIDEKELKQFLSEVYGISKNQAQGIIVPWDAKVYPMIKLKKPSDIKLKTIKLYGGGGTLIKPALTETLALMKFGDMVVILTDGDIFDGNEPSTQDLFRKVGQKSMVAIFATIIDQVHLTHKWKKIKIEV
jgi:predicted metal-dependent peptidase